MDRTIAFGEWLPDLPPYQNPGATIVKNVVPGELSYRPLRGFGSPSGALDGRCRGAIALIDKTGFARVYAGDSTKAYRYTGSAWVDVSRAGGYTLLESTGWSMVQFGDLVVAANGVSPLQQLSVLGNDTFEDIPGSPVASYLAVVRDFLFAGGIATDGQQLRWSGINSPLQWSTRVNLSGVQNFPDAGPIQGISGGEYGLIFQEFAITRATYVPDPNIVFQMDAIEERHGVSVPTSLVQYGRRNFYLSHNGFYVCDGTVSVPIGEQRIDKTFFNEFDEDSGDLVSAAIDPLNKLVIWAYPGTGHGGLANRVIIFNWAINRWAYGELDVGCFLRSQGAGISLDDLPDPSIDGMSLTLDDRSRLASPLRLYGFNSLNQFAQLNGSTLEATMETAEEQLFPGRRCRVKNVRPLIDGTASTVFVSGRVRHADAATYQSASNVNTDGMANILMDARYTRFRTTIAAGQDWTHGQGVEVEYTPSGRR